MKALLCAMDIEYRNCMKYFPEGQEHAIDKNCVIYCSEKYNILIAKTGVGKDAAYKCTEYINKHFDMELYCSYGIAGAFSQDICVGDIIISELVWEKMTTGVSLAYYSMHSLEKYNILSKINSIKQDNSIHIGSILCNNNFVMDKAEKVSLYADFKSLCVEMESAGIAKKCSEIGIEFICIKIISDASDKKAIRSIILEQDSITDNMGRILHTVFCQ